ncbi:MAG: TetR/AcrR family transcriptional regulator [Bacteroidales bacterium]|nr:TetR/AcrR family transcriptional regulator [Bacteroidales bacterium]
MKEHKDQRVNSIIEAAINEFVEKGYAGASMEGIAKRAELSKGGLYHHFSSKAEILFMVNQRFLEPVMELAGKIEVAHSVVAGLNRYIHDYFHYWSCHQRELNLYFLTMSESFSNPQIMELYRESTQTIFEYFGRLFQKGQAEGVLKPCNTYARAVALVSCLDGYLGYLLIDPQLDTEDIEKEIQQIFIKALLVSNNNDF